MATILRPVIRICVCIVMVIAVVAALSFVHPSDLPLAAALSFLVVAVLISSTGWDIPYAVFVSFLAALGFSWLIPPVGHVHLMDSRVTTVLTASLVAAVTASYVSDRLRRADRKRAEESARKSEGELRDLIENVPAIAFIALPGPSNTYVTRGWREYTGLSAEDTAGFGWQAVIHPEDTKRHMEKWRVCSATGEPFEDEVRFRRAADGEFRWFLVRAVPLCDVTGNILKWYGVLTDIEDRKRAEERPRLVLDSTPALIHTALPDGSLDFFNQIWLRYVGLSLEDMQGWNWTATIHPEDVEGIVNRWRASVASGEPFLHEARVRRADGEYRWMLHHKIAACDEEGNIVKWYGSSIDIEDRKRAEALLVGEKRVLELVAKGDPLPEILDSLCRMVEEQAGGALASILLVEGDRLKHGGAPSLPKAYTDAIDGVLIGPCVGSCGTAAYTGKQVIVEHIATDPLWANRDAALLHSLHACWSTPVFSSQGKVIATFAMYYREQRSPSRRDQEIIEQITHLAGVAIERKLTYDQLQRNETYLAEAQRLTHTGSWAYSPAAKKTLYWSDEMFQIFGLDPQNGLPNYDETKRVVHPDDLARVSKECLKAFREKAQFSQDYRLLLRDATLKQLHVLWHPVLDKDGELVEYVGTAADVTERKRAEQEREKLRELEAELAHVNRVSMLGELAAALSHELKQPIAAAITNANTCFRWLARDEPDVQEAREAAIRIVQDGNRATEIINRLRSFYTKGAPAERELVDVNEVLREMLALLQKEANRFSISMRTEAAAEFPKVRADRVQLQQVLLNLMLNGIDAMKETGGELTTKSELGQDGHLLISVSDTGVGLPAEQADQIFDAFFTTKPHGSGMGLAISRSIVESHGGRLWATSNAGRGAVFCFTLPTVAVEAQP